MAQTGPPKGRKTMGGLGVGAAPRRAGVKDIPRPPTAEPDDPTLVDFVPAPALDDPPPLDPIAPPPAPRAARNPGAHAGPAILPASPPAAVSDGSGRAEVEFEVVRFMTHADAQAKEQNDNAVVEVWTKNRIYRLDAKLLCIDVQDRATGAAIADHALRGSTLLGGQRLADKTVELSYPFPRLGTEAVFERRTGEQTRLSRTSRVERVVFRQHLVTVSQNELASSWKRITYTLDAAGHLAPASRKL